MTSRLERWRFAVGVLVHGVPAADVDPAWVPRADAWASEERTDQRRASALSILDDDVCGYFLLTFHREQVGLRADIAVSHVVDVGWWPAIADAVQRVRRDG